MRELVPTVFSEESAVPAPSFLKAEVRKQGAQPRDSRDFNRWLSGEVQNQRHPSGRINFLGLGHGGGPAHTVCPYSPNFLENVEPGVRSLVKACADKMLLPFSSCEGHSNGDIRYVALAFTEESDRDRLVEMLKMHFRPLFFVGALQLELRDSYVNVRAISQEENFGGLELAPDLGVKHESEYFNAVFFRNAESWCFLQINILGFYGWGRDLLTRKLEAFIAEGRHG